MKKAFLQYKTLIACLVVCAGAAGFWAANRGHAKAANVPPARDALAVLPTPTGNSLTDKEIAKWTEAVRKDPNSGKAWVFLGDSLMQKARETADSAYYTHAERAFQQALERNPRSAEATTGMAWVCGGRHEFEKSVEWANKALALDPQSQDAYGLLGDAAVEMGDYKDAEAKYQKMLDIRPDLASYSRGAHLLFQTGDRRKALWLMDKAINAGGPFAENTAWCRAQGALMLWNVGALVAAENTLEAGLKRTPNNIHLLAAMGRIKASKKDYAAAIAYYKKAIAIAPQHDSLVALGDLYAITGKKDEAERQYALVETIHKLQKANGVRGDMQMARFWADHDRNLPEALREAEAEYPTRKNVFATDTLAWALYKNGRFEDAEKTIRKALAIQTPDANIHYHAGLIYAKVGNHEAAQMQLYEALSLNPNFHPVYAKAASEALLQLGGAKPGAVAGE